MNMCFFASRVALSIADVVSIDFPRPTPTRPFLSPETTATEKVNLRPPAATRVTRRMSIIFVSNSGLTRSLSLRFPPRRGRESLLFFIRGGRASNAPGAGFPEKGAAIGAVATVAAFTTDAGAAAFISVLFCLFSSFMIRILVLLRVRLRQRPLCGPYTDSRHDRRQQLQS